MRFAKSDFSAGIQISGDMTTGSYNVYATGIADYPGLYLRLSDTASCDVSALPLQRVTDLPITGALLLSTKGGPRGYQYIHPSFNPNVASTYEIWTDRKVCRPL
jgi:hypothetical protein